MLSNPPVKAVFGAGRSGTTWLGSIIDSHPAVAYRFEPFHRLRNINSKIAHFLEVLESGNVLTQDLIQAYETLLKAHSLTDKPPFFPKHFLELPGKRALWLLTRKRLLPQKTYEMLYTPRQGTTLVFKEVGCKKQMNNLLKLTSVPVVYLVRHPCGNVLSDIKGQLDGKMPTGRQTVVQSLLSEHDPELFELYRSQLAEMTPAEKTALLWRIDVEKVMRILEQYPERAFLVTYEQLCDDTHHYTKKIFDYFGIEYGEQTENFINSLYEIPRNGKRLISKDLTGNFFTVFRNPKQQKDSWKKRISTDDRKKIESIVKGSSSFEKLATLGGWD